jgi:hypothetical protein
MTVLNALLASIQKAAEYNQNDTVAPAAVLWTASDVLAMEETIYQ